MSGKLTIECIRESFAEKGYTLLTTMYEGCFQKLEYVCPNKHSGYMSWNCWQRGQRCSKCSNNVKHTVKYIKEVFAEKGYTLLTTVYINNRQRLECICFNGHRCSISWHDWCRGRGCSICAKKRVSERQKKDFGEIKKSFVDAGYTLLTTVYVNNRQKLKYICVNGHYGEISWSDWQQGVRCPHFFNKAKKDINDIRVNVESVGYQLMSKKYINAKSKLHLKCPSKHDYFVSWNDWDQGCRCPKCSSQVSKFEVEIKNFVSALKIDHVENDRTQLTNLNTGRALELDIWMPKLNKAIECNGIYWHDKLNVMRNDEIKKQLCKKQGIDLLVITDKEWGDDIEKCQSRIKFFVG